MEAHNYTSLKERVWNTHLCSGCSLCATVCPMKTIYFSDEMPVSYNLCKNEKDIVPCGACYSSCPRIDTYKDKYGLGPVLNAYAARSTIPIEKQQSGGAVTAILYNALERKLIDRVVTVGQDHTTMQTYSIALSTPQEMITHAGSKYIWYTPSLLALRDLIEAGITRKIAIIGTPCVMQALRKMMESDNAVLRRFKDHVALLIGVFCTEIFSYDRAMQLFKDASVHPADVKRIDIKKDMLLELYNGDTVTVPLPRDLMRRGCAHCLDFTAVDADISAGSIGSREGFTTLITRNRTGEYYLNSAIENGYLETNKLDTLDKVETFAQRKYKRNKK